MADIHRVYTAYCVLLDILKSRGLDVSEYEGFSKDHVARLYASNQMDLLLKTEGPPSKKVYVRYELERAPDLHKLTDLFFESNGTEPAILTTEDDLIVVAKDPANDSKTDLMTDFWESRKVFVSILSLSDLQFNKFKAALVPSSIEILSEDDAKAVRAKYHVTDLQQLPTISRYDALGVLMGIRPGQMCKIQRDSVAALSLDFYRVCI
jgi:DNA-directed RNA polymerase subunit H (RpoH/RPB5)